MQSLCYGSAMKAMNTHKAGTYVPAFNIYLPVCGQRPQSIQQQHPQGGDNALPVVPAFEPMVDVIAFMERKNLFLRRRRIRNRFCATISLVKNLSNHFRRPMLHFQALCCCC